jgi:hypothetical protein
MKERRFGVLAAIAVAALLDVTGTRADDRATSDKTDRATSDKTDRATTDKTDRATTDKTDRATIDKTEIIGNRELPKVLYIVPWKKPAAGELSGPPVESVLDEALAPIDRDVFRRQVHYDTLMHPAVAAPAMSGGGAATPAPGRN